jgi:hypothetical protein
MCPLSNSPLKRPVVSDCAGILYNKDVVLQFLLPADVSPLNKEDCDRVILGRIKSLRDVIEVLFEVDADSSAGKEKWLCPVTSKELGPAVRAVYLVPCGHAFSNEAIKEMKTNQCLQCNISYSSENIIPLFPATEYEKSFLQERITTLSKKGLTHSLKSATTSSKKRKANKLGQEAKETTPKSSDHLDSSIRKSRTAMPTSELGSSISRTSTPKASTGIHNAATAHLTARVLEEEDGRKKQRLVRGENENLKSLFLRKDEKSKLGSSGDFMTRGFSIPANSKYD